MKTVLFGYSRKETNEELDTITKKNSRLQSEVEELRARLYDAQNEKSDEQWEAEQKELEGRLRKAENENINLRKELEALKKEISESEYSADDIGAMYQEAYGDVIRVKTSVREHMTEVIDDFVNDWETAYKQMEAMLDKNTFMRKKVRENFGKSVAEIMSSFDEMDEMSEKMYTETARIKAEKDRIQKLLEKPVNDVFVGHEDKQE